LITVKFKAHHNVLTFDRRRRRYV